MKTILKILPALALSLALASCSSLAGNKHAKKFDVRQFGAAGDGKTLDTAAIQNALDECAQSGGGVVEMRAGIYLSKPVFLRNKTTLQLDTGAVLQARDEPSDFLDASGATLAFVNGKNLTNIVISGRGTIDGAGARWWAPARAAKMSGQPETVRRPRLVVLANCKNVRVENVTLQNSPSFHLVPSDCEDVVITNVTIQAPADSPNTDAIDPSCKNLLITHCRLDVGDDNVAIKAGHKVAGREFQDENITITDCTFLRGHGMSIGSETRGGVKNLLVKNCTFDGTTSGIRIKTSRARGGTIESLVYRDLTMTNVEIPINITCYYPKIPATDSAQPVTADTPVYRDIQIINLTASGPKSAGFIVGLPEMCVSNVVFENVKLSAGTGLTIRNAKGIRFKNSSVTVKRGAPFTAENADVQGLGEPEK
jgi:polygalacturonase